MVGDSLIAKGIFGSKMAELMPGLMENPVQLQQGSEVVGRSSIRSLHQDTREDYPFAPAIFISCSLPISRLPSAQKEGPIKPLTEASLDLTLG